MQLAQGKKIYFASDLHLGVPDYNSSLAREKLFIEWLDQVKLDAQEIFLVGDVFDFWFEYKQAVPRGFVRLLGKLAEIADSGIPIHFFTGNHDMWIFDYLPHEIGAKLYKAPIVREWNGKNFYIGHGDGFRPWRLWLQVYQTHFWESIFSVVFCAIASKFWNWIGQLLFTL